MFIVLSSWHGHCESSPGSFDQCRLSAGWPPTQPIWAVAVSPPIGCYHPQTPSPFIIITQLVNWYSFSRPTEDGRLSRPKHCSKGAQPVPKRTTRAQGCISQRPWWDSKLGLLAPQLGVLPLSHHNLHCVYCKQSLPDHFNSAPGKKQPHDGLFILQLWLRCQQSKQNQTTTTDLHRSQKCHEQKFTKFNLVSSSW